MTVLKSQIKTNYMTPPTTIFIKSDSNELQYLNTIKPNGKGEVQYIYKYIKSNSKLGNLLGLNEVELVKLIKTNI